MNRPLKRKIENAVLAFLEANKAGTPFASLTIVSGHGTSLADEIALDADSSAEIDVQEPQMPFLAVFAQTRADQQCPNIYSFELVLHYKHDATNAGQRRYDADAIMRAVLDTITAPEDANALTDDDNSEFGALLDFANIDPDPQAADTRPAYRRPLHIYGMNVTSENTLFDETAWHDQLSFTGDCQDIDARDPA